MDAHATAQGSPIATVNPYTGERVREFPPLSTEDVARAIDAAHSGYPAWRARSTADRGALVQRAGRLMRERKEELAHLLTLEVGKLIDSSRAEVDLHGSHLSGALGAQDRRRDGDLVVLGSDDHVEVVVDELPSELEADAARGAGDDRQLPLAAHGGVGRGCRVVGHARRYPRPRVRFARPSARIRPCGSWSPAAYGPASRRTPSR